MKTKSADEVIYQIQVCDLQEVADRIIKRPLTKTEIVLVGDSVGDNIDWVQAIELAIEKHIDK